jgi:hypothetical protein
MIHTYAKHDVSGSALEEAVTGTLYASLGSR